MDITKPKVEFVFSSSDGSELLRESVGPNTLITAFITQTGETFFGRIDMNSDEFSPQIAKELCRSFKTQFMSEYLNKRRLQKEGERLRKLGLR